MQRDTGSSRRRHGRSVGWIVALLVTSSLLLAACGGSSNTPTVAGSGAPTKTTSSAKHSGGGALAYAACMRSHGLPNFPDPNSDGGFDGTGGVSMSSPKYTSANQACQSDLGGGHQITPAMQKSIEAHALAFAQCMRSHGVPNYPDPKITFSGGGVSETSGGPQGSGLDPQSPKFQSAQQACQNAKGGGNGG